MELVMEIWMGLDLVRVASSVYPYREGVNGVSLTRSDLSVASWRDITHLMSYGSGPFM